MGHHPVATLKTPLLVVLSVFIVSALASGLNHFGGAIAGSKRVGQSGSQDQDDVIKVRTDLVVVNVTVLDKDGKFVPHLKRTDFRIFEDGDEQKISTFTAEETPFAAAVLLDTSGSMESRLTLGRGAAIHFLDGLRDEDVAAIYNFDSKVEQIQDFSPGRDLPAKAFGLRTKNQTALNDAVLQAAVDLGKREEKRRAIVVLSDGGENFSRASSDKALERALQAGATIYAVNMGEQGPGRDLMASGILKNFALKSGGRYIDSPGGQALRDAFAEIAEELGHQYTIAYRPTNHAHDGKWRAIDVKLARADVIVRTRKGYKAPKA
ncbi:MAG TPA: VWA domain-containing protein [Pyrinomonadaceae bacterium]|nr:VWA domain-containing protein [Pyrinomonadaceae bacterium]